MLVKPQFAARREDVGKRGVIKSPEAHAQVLKKVIQWSENIGIKVVAQCASPILGDAGNQEFFLLLKKLPEA